MREGFSGVVQFDSKHQNTHDTVKGKGMFFVEHGGERICIPRQFLAEQSGALRLSRIFPLAVTFDAKKFEASNVNGEFIRLSKHNIATSIELSGKDTPAQQQQAQPRRGFVWRVLPRRFQG